MYECFGVLPCVLLRSPPQAGEAEKRERIGGNGDEARAGGGDDGGAGIGDVGRGLDRGFGSVRVSVDREDGWGSVDVEVEWLAGGAVEVDCDFEDRADWLEGRDGAGGRRGMLRGENPVVDAENQVPILGSPIRHLILQSGIMGWGVGPY